MHRRLATLRHEHASVHDWRQLQFDATREYLAGQRRFVALHTQLLDVLTSDRDLHHQQRHEALELFLALSELHELVNTICGELNVTKRA